MAEYELDFVATTEIGEPVPGEDALDADHEIFAVRVNGGEEVVGAALHVLVKQDLPVSVHNAEVHGLGVKIDPAVMLVVLGVESHGSLLEWLLVVLQPAYSVWRRFEEGA
jgi:hypothetical protein